MRYNSQSKIRACLHAGGGILAVLVFGSELTECLESTLSPDLMVSRALRELLVLGLAWRTLLSRTGAARQQATRAVETRKMIDVRIILAAIENCGLHGERTTIVQEMISLVLFLTC